ncbi:MAG: repeat protein [Chthoniobacteraceae bacterium]|nr:repeat protein [Chthoniobacteraceae bacterium]
MIPLPSAYRARLFSFVEPLEARVAPANAAVINLSSLNAINGFKINGEPTVAALGTSVSAAGDINGDGFGDVIIGAYRASSPGGVQSAAYVLFGKASGFSPGLDLSALNPTDGFKIMAEDVDDNLGAAVSAAGDVNGDGFDDLIVGTPGADPNGESSGAAYVIFGQATPFAASVGLSTLTGANGFKISGEAAGDNAGRAVSSAGDINNDGFSDLLIGAPMADSNGIDSGSGYVIFGKATGFPANIALSSLTGTDGFKLNGEGISHYAGHAVSSAGDINGDGFDDLLIGAPGANPHGISSGAAYVVLGKASGFPATVELSALAAPNGFRINGVAKGDNAGFAVGAAGDFNGDGLDDLLVGAPEAQPNGAHSGATYLIFGTSTVSELALSLLNGTTGFKISGEAATNYSGESVSGTGDVNGDGFDDIIIGAQGNSANGSFSGASYVIFGHRTGFTSNLKLSTLSGTQGYKLSGEAASDGAGFAVSGAGDVNGDGLNDLLIGAPHFKENISASYLVFGSQTILIDPAARTATFTDIDGDLVTIKVSKGTLFPSDLHLSGPSSLGGATLEMLDLSGHADLKDANISITAKPGPLGGDGFVNIGYFNASGFDLGTVFIDGDLGRIDAGNMSNFSTQPAVKSLTVGSIGVAGLNTQDPGSPSLISHISRDLGALTVRTDIQDATLVIGGGAGAVKVGGNLDGAHLYIMGGGSPLALKSLGVGGSVLRSQILVGYDFTVATKADVQIGAVTVNDNWVASDLVAGIRSTNSTFGDADDTLIPGGSAAVPATIKSVVIKGQASGSFEAGGRFGIVAESIGLVTAGHVKYDLTSAPGEIFFIGATGDFQGREVPGPATGPTFPVLTSVPVTIGTTGRIATLTDADGDIVTVTVNRGTLLATDFVTDPSGLGGTTFRTLNFHADLSGANVTIIATPGPLGGDGLVNLGYLNAAGLDLGTVSIGGDLGRIDAGTGGDLPAIKLLKVNSFGLAGLGTQEAMGASAISSINGNIGALNVQTDVRGVTLAVDGRVGAVALGGDLIDAHLLINGGTPPASGSTALALKSVAVAGNVTRSQILAGYDLTGGVNADVQIGNVTIGGDCVASDLVAGVLANNGVFGDADDKVIAGGSASIVARIAKVLIKGTAAGTFEPGGQFGIVAQAIGAVNIGHVKVPLSAIRDVFAIGSTDDFCVREVS